MSNGILDWLIGDIDYLRGHTSMESVSADNLRGIADNIIKDGDDAQSIIESASAESVFWMEPGGTWDLTSTLQPPARSAMLSHTGRLGVPGATFVKQFDGTMMEVPTGLFMRAIEFDGNKSNGYTGNGLVDVSKGTKENYWQWVLVRQQAGDARVTDGHYFSTYDGCRFASNDGWGIRHTSSTSTEVSQNTYRGRTQIDGNGAGGVKYENFTHAESYPDILVHANGGPAFYSTAGISGMEIFGLIENNDGPLWLADQKSDGSSAQVKGLEIGGRLINNNQSPGTEVIDAGTRNVGEIHVQQNCHFAGAISNARINGSVAPFASYSSWAGEGTIIGGRAEGFSDAAHLDSAGDTFVAFNTISLPGSLTSGSSGTGYHYDETGGSAL